MADRRSSTKGFKQTSSLLTSRIRDASESRGFSQSRILTHWEEIAGKLDSVNYDWRNRKRRQDIPKQYIENGSFYLFRPEVLRKNNNRFGGRIGVVEMEFWKMFEIDSIDDLRMCSALMKEFLLEKLL